MCKKLLKQALDALEYYRSAEDYGPTPASVAIESISAALAQPEPQPVAWANINKQGDITRTSNKRDAWAMTPLYTHA